MRTLTIAVLATLSIILLGVPAALADSSTVMFSPNPIPPGGTTVATVHLDSANCPAGDSYFVDVYVMDPTGHTFLATNSTPTPCGTDLTFTFPTDFLNNIFTANTNTCGQYSMPGASATVSDPAGSVVGSPSLFGSGFTVTCPTGVPEFPAGLAILFLLAVPALLILRHNLGQRRLGQGSRSTMSA